MRFLHWITVAAAVTFLACALLVTGRLPLGIPGQWEWGRWEQQTPWVDWLIVGVLSTSYITCVALGARWVIGSIGRRLTALLLLFLAGFAVQMGMQQLGFGLGKWAFVLYSPSSSGYYTAAKRDVQSVRQFLADYDRIQREYHERFGPLHLATHPPGLVLLHYASLRLCEISPGVTRFMLAVQPQTVADGFREVVSGPALPPADQASIWLVALACQCASAMAVIPIYLLARRVSGAEAAWYSAALWPLVPAVTIFMPKSDVLYAFFAAASVAAALPGRTTFGRFLWGLASGAILCSGMFLSFGLITVAPLTVLAVGLAEYTHSETMIRRVAPKLSGLLLAFAAAEIILWYATGYSLAATWWRCYRIHATFYDAGQLGAARSYWPWAGFNLAEFAVATGLPLTVAAIVGSVRLFRQRADRQTPLAEMSGAPAQNEACANVQAVVAGWWLLLLFLNLSGKNRGEIARLWMFLMPFACVAAAPALERFGSARWSALVTVLLSLQAAQTAAFAAHVQGFYDPSSIHLPNDASGQPSAFILADY